MVALSKIYKGPKIGWLKVAEIVQTFKIKRSSFGTE